MIYSQSRADGIRREKWWVRVVSRPRRGGRGWREAGARGESEQSQWPASEGVINLKLKFRSSLKRFSLPRRFHRPVLPPCRGCSNRKTRFRGSLWRSSSAPARFLGRGHGFSYTGSGLCFTTAFKRRNLTGSCSLLRFFFVRKGDNGWTSLLLFLNKNREERENIGLA